MDPRQWQVCPYPTKQSIRILALAFALSPCPAFSSTTQIAALADLSLEELANIEITSVSKRAERVLDAPASIFVITNDDIRRSGARSLPEALRLAPNLDVARVNSSTYAISARGFNNAIGNKLLVLIDGRTVYTPLFSGVNWDIQNVMLEDVERVEVISGPGATLWGANAVNGVINVITRKAQDSQGSVVSGAAGNQGQQGSARYGATFGDTGHYRVYATGFNQDAAVAVGASPMDSAWKLRQGGFRADWGSPTSDSWTVQGDMYEADMDAANVTGVSPTRSGSNLLARWGRQLDNDSRLHVQAYVDQTKQFDPAFYSDEEDTYDLEANHSFVLNGNHRILWGGGIRRSRSTTVTDVANSPVLPFPLAPGVTIPFQFLFGYDPPQRALHWHNLFVQDEIEINPDLTVTLGIKGESNSYTGMEYLPSARIAYKPDSASLLWSALSRTVRAPSRIDRELNWYAFFPTLPPGAQTAFLIAGGPDFKSETAKTLEVGYRAQPTSRVSYSATAFYTKYDHLRSGQPVAPPAPLPAVVVNMMEGNTYGIEAWGTFQAQRNWRLSGGLKTIREDFTLKPGSLDPDGFTDAGNDPSLTWMLRSTYNITGDHDFDLMVRHSSPLPNPSLQAYTSVDMRLAWRPQKDLELSFVVLDAFDSTHQEFVETNGNSYEIGRSFLLKATASF